MNKEQMKTTRTTDEVEAFLREIATRKDRGEDDPYSAMSYYNGIEAALEWMLGEVESADIL